MRSTERALPCGSATPLPIPGVIMASRRSTRSRICPWRFNPWAASRTPTHPTSAPPLVWPATISRDFRNTGRSRRHRRQFHALEVSPMIRSCTLSVAGLLLAAGLTFADPTVEVRYIGGVPEITLTGSYPQSRYTVWRADSPDGPFLAISRLDLLCLGTCFTND